MTRSSGNVLCQSHVYPAARAFVKLRMYYRGCSHSLMFKPADLLATLVAHTLVNSTRHLWLLRPDSSRFVTSPRPGYANRPIRAIDGMWTFTTQDSQPCRLFLRRDPLLTIWLNLTHLPFFHQIPTLALTFDTYCYYFWMC